MFKSDFHVKINTDAVLHAMDAAGVAVRLSLAQEIRNEAAVPPRSPYDTGHNAASIVWIGPDGRLQGREPVKRRKNKEGKYVKHPPRASNANNVHNRGDIMVATTSGYGGFLEVGTKKMRPRFYIRGAMFRIARSRGWQALAGRIARSMAENVMAQRRWASGGSDG